MSNDAQDNAALRAYTRTRSELMGILRTLRDAEIQNDVDLPHVVVVGTQSVGKSSLVEAISGLKLPRESGTCTRCPMECRLENSPRVSVNITLRFTKDGTGRNLPDVREIPFRSELTNLDDVREVLRDAQRNILQPSLLEIPELGSSGDTPLSFSENCVCVHAKGPKMPDLYFYDLPGIIANVRDGEDHRHIDLLQDLVRKYVAKPNCVVLLVIACNYDLENQGAAPLVLGDPNLRQRTVGVLTKVDRIESGMEATWIRLFDNKTIVLRNGWFAVKLPAQTDLDLPWERACEQERTFFSATEPWKLLSRVSPDHKHRLGSQLVAEHLSKLLSSLVANELPNIHRDIAKSLQGCSVELARFPERSSEDSHKEIISLIRDFMYNVSKHINGAPPKLRDTKPSLIFAVNEIFSQLKVEIYGTAPQFFPWTKEYADNLPEITESLGDLIGGQGTVMYLDEVKKIAYESKIRELPGHTPDVVNVTLIEDFMTGWEIKAISCFEQVRDILVRHLHDMVHTHFAQYVHGGLLDEVSAIVSQQISRCALSTMQRVKELCRMDLQPFTLLSEEYIHGQETFHSRYARLYRRTLSPADQHVPGAMTTGPTSTTTSPDQTAPPNDEWHKALMIMASVRSYFQIASKRFVDAVPKLIDEVFLRACDSSIGIAVMQLNLSPQRCLMFLADPSAPEKRHEILEKKKRLEIAKQKLDKVFLPPSAEIAREVNAESVAGDPSPDSWDSTFIPFSLFSSTFASQSGANISELSL